MTKFLSIGAVLVALLISTQANASPLSPQSPAYKQLEAMGYDFLPVDANDAVTVIKLGETKLAISESGYGMSVARYFNREKKNLTDAQRLKLLDLINQVNIDMSYQVSLTDEFLCVATYIVGPYNPKNFGAVVSLMASARVIFDKYPALLAAI